MSVKTTNHKNNSIPASFNLWLIIVSLAIDSEKMYLLNHLKPFWQSLIIKWERMENSDQLSYFSFARWFCLHCLLKVYIRKISVPNRNPETKLPKNQITGNWFIFKCTRSAFRQFQILQWCTGSKLEKTNSTTNVKELIELKVQLKVLKGNKATTFTQMDDNFPPYISFVFDKLLVRLWRHSKTKQNHVFGVSFERCILLLAARKKHHLEQMLYHVSTVF